MSHALRAFGLILAVNFLVNGHAVADSTVGPCDRNLIVLPTSPVGYRLRGERCEGLYVERVSGSVMLVVSWTAVFEDFDVPKFPKLTLDWDTPAGAGPVRLRAQGLRRRLYYRMDALRPAGSSTFAWPTDLLAELGLPGKDLGIVALSSMAVGGMMQEVYMPLRIMQRSSLARSTSYRLAVLPGAELGEVYVTLIMAGGSSDTVLKDGEALGYGYYPANRPFEIAVSVLGKGFYRLTLAAVLKSGGAATTEFWFYHPGI